MIDTPTARSLEAPSQPAVPKPLGIELSGITFEDERLWQPRYDTLFDYGRVTLPDQSRIEPSFQFRSEAADPLVITLELASTGFRFRTEKGSDEVTAYSIADPYLPSLPGLVEIRLDGSEQRCRLVWDSAAATDRATTLRIACDGGRAHNPYEKALAAVEGGLFLSLVKPASFPRPEPCPVPPNQGERPDFVIELIAIDDYGRPRYDVIQPGFYETLPGSLETEPAFRLPRGAHLPFGIELGGALPSSLKFLANCGPGPDQIKVFPFQPRRRNHLPHLDPTRSQRRGRCCAMRWHRPDGPPHGTVGSVSTYFLGVMFEKGAKIPDNYRKLVMDDGQTLSVTLDPTVIQPPPCDPLTQTCVP